MSIRIRTPVQSELIDLLSGETNSLMAVGDDSQSIYSWRGAEVDHILNFEKRYPASVIHTIETNYRSVPEILDLSNAAISANKMRFEKNLRSSRAEVGAKPALVALEDPATQAAFVAQRMLELRDEEGIELTEMAVLYRAHFQSLEIQMELTRRGIPFAITSGLRFFEQAHIKDVAAFLRFVTNRKDEVSFKRMVQMLPGCGPAPRKSSGKSGCAIPFPEIPNHRTNGRKFSSATRFRKRRQSIGSSSATPWTS